MAEQEVEQLCIFMLADGTAVCRACDDPPADFTKRMIAPPGTQPGEVSPKMFVKQGAGE